MWLFFWGGQSRIDPSDVRWSAATSGVKPPSCLMSDAHVGLYRNSTATVRRSVQTVSRTLAIMTPHTPPAVWSGVIHKEKSPSKVSVYLLKLTQQQAAVEQLCILFSCLFYHLIFFIYFCIIWHDTKEESKQRWNVNVHLCKNFNVKYNFQQDIKK